MTCVVLTGAGASAAISNVAPYSPPLGRDLLPELIANTSAWRDMPEELRAGFTGTGGFEAGFANVREKNDWLTVPLLLAMAGYFLRFKPTARTKYDFFLEAMARRDKHTYFATLNYDLLLDHAVASVFRRGPDYDGERELVTVLKLHGAPNIWPDPNFFQSKGGGGLSGFDVIIEGGPLVILSHEESIARWRSETVVCPSMALYSPDKKVLFNPQFTNRVQARYSKLVGLADEIVVVGASYAKHDRHVWAPIEETAAHVRIIDPLPDAFGELKQERASKGRTSVTTATFADLIQSADEILARDSE